MDGIKNLAGILLIACTSLCWFSFSMQKSNELRNYFCLYDWGKGIPLIPSNMDTFVNPEPSSCKALAIALRKNECANFIECLLKNGVDVHKKLDMDYSFWGEEITTFYMPLALASLHREPTVTKVLIDYGATKSLKEEDGHAILIHFIRNLFSDLSLFGHPKKYINHKIAMCIDCLDLLINAGCPVDNMTENISSLLQINIEQGYVVNYPVEEIAKISPLKIAVEQQCRPLIRFLLRKGADIYKTYGDTSAFKLAQKKNILQNFVSLVKRSLVKRKEELNILEVEIANLQADEAKIIKIQEEEAQLQIKIKSKVDFLNILSERIVNYYSNIDKNQLLPKLLLLCRK